MNEDFPRLLNVKRMAKEALKIIDQEKARLNQEIKWMYAHITIVIVILLILVELL